MHSASATTFRPPSFPILPSPNSPNPNPNRTQFTQNTSNHRPISATTIQLDQIHHPKHTNPKSQNPNPNQPYLPNTLTITEKLNILVSEFKSLPAPIDRVKRLIHYASLLPEFNQSCRIESNRVTGCTAQVWLEVAIDVEGSVLFRVDSDSEITKGFCYCLIWLLDGASPGDVIEIRVDDLGEMNLGILPIRVSSRVNTWHNVLISMQRRTRELIVEGSYGGTDCNTYQNAGVMVK